jgi:AcrR family transcriptional regulator
MTKRTRKNGDSTTRDRALGAAARIFAERGYGMTSMRDIARAARIRVATLYHHFQSKDDLYLEVLEREQQRLREMMNEVLSEESDFPTMITRMLERSIDYHLRNPDLARLGLRAALGDGLTRPYDPRWLGMMDVLLRPRSAKGEIKPIDPALFLVTTGAIIQSHVIAADAYRALVGKSMTAEEAERRIRDHVVQVVLRSLGIEKETTTEESS